MNSEFQSINNSVWDVVDSFCKYNKWTLLNWDIHQLDKRYDTSILNQKQHGSLNSSHS